MKRSKLGTLPISAILYSVFCILYSQQLNGQDSVGVGYFSIQGSLVTESTTVPATGVTVLLFKGDGTTVGQTRTDDTGKFQFRGLTKGTYEVIVQVEHRSPMREIIAMNTQNQIYQVLFYLRPPNAQKPEQNAVATVNIAYLQLSRGVRDEFDRAVRWTDEGKYDKSVKALMKVLAREPGFGPAHNQLGINLYNLGRPQEAVKAFLQAIAVDPQYSHALTNAGKVFNESGDYLKAIEFLKSGVTYDTSSALGFFQLGIAYYHLNSLQVAESYLKKALQLDLYRRYPVRLELANLYLKRGLPAPASEHLKAFIEENPNAPQVTQAKQALAKLLLSPAKP
jgi:tetratricopeptide (TPR) repeat protein